jgi:peptidoglycan/LPS O-acetylase OafA/YrhL
MTAFRATWDRARDILSPPAAPTRIPTVGHWFGPTLGDLAVGRVNNFNLLRFVAASMVLFFHCFALTGHKISELPVPTTVGFMDLGLLGVAIFFAISGFLIAQSVTRSRSIFRFVTARALRILPALALSTLFCVVFIGPLATSLPQGEYWTDARTWRYLFHTVVLDPQARLPGVFEHNPYPPAVNGSLWTIPIEVWCYALLAAAAFVGLCRSRWQFNVVAIAALLAFANYEPFLRQQIPSGAAWSTAYLVGVFFFGAWCFLHREFLPASLLAAGAVVLLAIALLDTPLSRYALFGAVTYLTLIIAHNARLRVAWFLKLGDYSYGIYVFAFPVQQFLVSQFGINDPITLFALAFTVTLGLAIFSWHIVERPALAKSSQRGQCKALARG